jgi:hypothetical protein
VELFNPNEEDIILEGWYLQRKTETGFDFSTYASNNLFSGQKIEPKSYFTISNVLSSFLGNINTANPLTENNTLVLKNPNREVVDMVGWGNAQDFETFPFVSPTATTSIGRKWSTSTENYIDTDDNFKDFESQILTPGFKNEYFSLNFATSSDSTTTDLEATSTEETLPDGNNHPTTTEATATLSVIVSEVAWMGNASSSYDEWIEIYNNTDESIDLSGWVLYI